MVAGVWLMLTLCSCSGLQRNGSPRYHVCDSLIEYDNGGRAEMIIYYEKFDCHAIDSARFARINHQLVDRNMLLVQAVHLDTLGQRVRVDTFDDGLIGSSIEVVEDWVMLKTYDLNSEVIKKVYERPSKRSLRMLHAPARCTCP